VGRAGRIVREWGGAEGGGATRKKPCEGGRAARQSAEAQERKYLLPGFVLLFIVCRSISRDKSSSLYRAI
jgi:hypothetical protein